MDGADVTSNGKVFQSWGPATGNSQTPTVERRTNGWTHGAGLCSTLGWRAGDLRPGLGVHPPMWG